MYINEHFNHFQQETGENYCTLDEEPKWVKAFKKLAITAVPLVSVCLSVLDWEQ